MKKVIVLLFLLISLQAQACYWDHDTLAMETQAFPSVLEVISGEILIHSKAFYEWRINDRLGRLKTEPNNYALYDDLAMAYDKVGETEKGIEVLLSVLDSVPRRYETISNLGTLYIHSRQFEKGGEYLEKAIEINPNAHFGREIFQLYLVKYMMARKSGYELHGRSIELNSFATYLGYERKNDRRLGVKLASGEGMEKAIEGLVGMLHFGNNNSPVMLEALGDLLSCDMANRLAARAFLKASLYSQDQSEKNRLYAKAVDSVAMQEFDELISPKEIDKIEYINRLLNDEMKAGALFQALITRLEADWIKEGKNVEKEFDKHFYSN